MSDEYAAPKRWLALYDELLPQFRAESMGELLSSADLRELQTSRRPNRSARVWLISLRLPAGEPPRGLRS